MHKRASTCVAGALVVLAGLIAGPVPPAAAQQSGGHLTGRVTLEDGSGLPGVVVHVATVGALRSRTAVTNANGEFRLFLPPGEQRVTMRLEGFVTESRTVTIREGASESLSVEMQLAEMEESLIVTGEAPRVIEVSTGPQPEEAIAFVRPLGYGGLSVGIAVNRPAVDRVEVGLPSRARRALEPGALTPGWTYDSGTGSASGPAVDSFRLRLDGAAGLKLPDRIKIEAQLDGEEVFSDKVAVEQRPAIDLSAVPYLGLPEVIVPGEEVFVTVPEDLDATVRLDYGGEIGAYDLSAPGPSAPLLPEGFPGLGRTPLVGTVPYADLPGLIRVTAVDGWDQQLFLYEWDPVVVESGLAVPRQVITGASDLAFAGQQLCICGSFTDPGPLSDLQIGGRPLGPPVGFSPYVANFTTPELAPGPYEVGWQPGGGEGGPFVTEVIEILAKINDEVIQKGGTTGLEMEIVGTDRALPVELENRSPKKISMKPSDLIQTTSTGGPGLNHVPGIEVKGKKQGTYLIDWTVGTGECPCAATLPETEDRWATLVDEAVAKLTVAGTRGEDGTGGGQDDRDSDSDSDSMRGCGDLRLLDDRFQIQVVSPEGSSPAGGCELATPSGGLLAFLERNEPVLIQVINGCDSTGSFWVFAGSLTDVEYTLTVTDTESGDSRAYTNPLGNAAAAILDTEAFSTCP